MKLFQLVFLVSLLAEVPIARGGGRARATEVDPEFPDIALEELTLRSSHITYLSKCQRQSVSIIAIVKSYQQCHRRHNYRHRHCCHIVVAGIFSEKVPQRSLRLLEQAAHIKFGPGMAAARMASP